MKGPRLHIYILTSIALLLALVMIGWNLYPSWSQYARTPEEILLLPCLSAIAMLFILRAFNHEYKDKVMYEWPTRVTLGQGNIYSAYLFLGVLCTPVTIGLWWIEILHYLFTITAIGFAYGEVVNYYNNSLSRTLAWIGLGIGAAGMLMGYFTNLWTLGVGEMIATIPLAIHIVNTNYKTKT